MRAYVLSLGTGLLIGVIYQLLGVRSPAPPLVALLGLLGILLGEQVVPASQQLLRGTSFGGARNETRAADPAPGRLPGRPAAPTVPDDEHT